LDDQGLQIPKIITPQAENPVEITGTETDCETLNHVVADNEESNESSEWDAMNEDSDIFLQVEDGSNYLRNSAPLGPAETLGRS